PLTAQEHPNTDRGFTAERSFLSGDIDNVNTFNGNLLLTIPAGPTYPVGAELAYGLTLTYNSNLWDFQEISTGQQAIPNRKANAGFGWTLSLGMLYDDTSYANDTDHSVFVGPDGAEHTFFPTLHGGDPDDPGDSSSVQNVQYTRDGSYLRLLVTATQRQ